MSTRKLKITCVAGKIVLDSTDLNDLFLLNQETWEGKLLFPRILGSYKRI